MIGGPAKRPSAATWRALDGGAGQGVGWGVEGSQMESADRDWLFAPILVLLAIAALVYMACRWRDLTREIEKMGDNIPSESIER